MWQISFEPFLPFHHQMVRHAQGPSAPFPSLLLPSSSRHGKWQSLPTPHPPFRFLWSEWLFQLSTRALTCRHLCGLSTSFPGKNKRNQTLGPQQVPFKYHLKAISSGNPSRLCFSFPLGLSVLKINGKYLNHPFSSIIISNILVEFTSSFVFTEFLIDDLTRPFHLCIDSVSNLVLILYKMFTFVEDVWGLCQHAPPCWKIRSRFA